jgi:hypothetical protein
MGNIANVITNLTEYRPYSLSKQRNDIYVDIVFQDEGIMTVPKASGNAIVDLLNDAFRNGVKMTIKKMALSGSGSVQTEPIVPQFRPTPMPQEEEHPINRQVKRL